VLEGDAPGNEIIMERLTRESEELEGLLITVDSEAPSADMEEAQTLVLADRLTKKRHEGRTIAAGSR
jgi:hypothetical protein